MSKQYNVGLVGVGAVGAEMIKVLKDRHFPCGKVQVFASRERDDQGACVLVAPGLWSPPDR